MSPRYRYVPNPQCRCSVALLPFLTEIISVPHSLSLVISGGYLGLSVASQDCYTYLYNRVQGTQALNTQKGTQFIDVKVSASNLRNYVYALSLQQGVYHLSKYSEQIEFTNAIVMRQNGSECFWLDSAQDLGLQVFVMCQEYANYTISVYLDDNNMIYILRIYRIPASELVSFRQISLETSQIIILLNNETFPQNLMLAYYLPPNVAVPLLLQTIDSLVWGEQDQIIAFSTTEFVSKVQRILVISATRKNKLLFGVLDIIDDESPPVSYFTSIGSADLVAYFRANPQYYMPANAQIVQITQLNTSSFLVVFDNAPSYRFQFQQTQDSVIVTVVGVFQSYAPGFVAQQSVAFGNNLGIMFQEKTTQSNVLVVYDINE